MLELLWNIDFNKINCKFDIKNIYAGIIYDSDGIIVDKVMYEKINDKAQNVFNNNKYSFFKNSEFYIDNEVSLKWLLNNFFQLDELSFKQLLMAYKMFLNDDKFINEHLEYFGMIKISVGYKGKEEIVKNPHSFNKNGQELYYKLLSIINCKELKKEYDKTK